MCIFKKKVEINLNDEIIKVISKHLPYDEKTVKDCFEMLKSIDLTVRVLYYSSANNKSPRVEATFLARMLNIWK